MDKLIISLKDWKLVQDQGTLFDFDYLESPLPPFSKGEIKE